MRELFENIFHLRSRGPCVCLKARKRRPGMCPKLILSYMCPKLILSYICYCFLWPPVKINVRSSVLWKAKNQNLSRSFTYVSELAGQISSDELRELLLSKLVILPEQGQSTNNAHATSHRFGYLPSLTQAMILFTTQDMLTRATA